MKSNSAPISNGNPFSSPQPEKTNSDFWKTVRTNIKLQHQAPAIQPVPRTGNLPLAFAQERLWLLDQLLPASSVYNMCAAYRLKGLLKLTALEQSLSEIINRHEILRTTFALVEEQPVQFISPNIDWKLPLVDLRNLPEAKRGAEAELIVREDAEEPFDLEKIPLWRFKLLRLEEEEYILLRTVHHIIFDGWSYRMFMRELAALYEAFSNGKPSPLPKLLIQYADFAVWQRQWLQGEVLESQLDYWKQQLGGSVPPLDLPIDYPRKPIPNYQGMSQLLVLSETLTEALKALSHQEGVSLFITLLTALKTLLYQYTKQEDMIVCSPIAGRHRLETKRLIGYFNNIIVLRTGLSGNPSFRELISRVSQVTLGANEHQDLPFQKLTELPNLASTPLNRCLFVLQNTPSQPLDIAGINVRALDVKLETTNFDLFFSFKEEEKTLKGVMQYRTDLFESTTIIQMVENFQTLLESLVANPDQCLGDLPALRRTELHQLTQEKAAYVAPRKEIEQIIAAVWQEVLHVEKIGIHDNFFALGGHSLLAVRLIAAIEKQLNQHISLSTIFQSPTIEELAQIMLQPESSSLSSSLVIIKSGENKPPLFLLQVLGEGLELALALADYLDADQPVYGLVTELMNPFSLTEFKKADDIIDYYIKEIRTIQPEGPYYLAGMFCGGRTAYQVAQQLEADGQQVALLALIESFRDRNTVLKKMSVKEKLLANLKLLFKLGPNYLLRKIQAKISDHQNKLVNAYVNLCKYLRLPVRQNYQEIVASDQENQRIRDILLKKKFNLEQVYQGPVTLFRSMDEIEFYHFDLGWSKMAPGGLEIYEFSGTRKSVLTNPYIKPLAEKLQICINKARDVRF